MDSISINPDAFSDCDYTRVLRMEDGYKTVVAASSSEFTEQAFLSGLRYFESLTGSKPNTDLLGLMSLIQISNYLGLDDTSIELLNEQIGTHRYDAAQDFVRDVLLEVGAAAGTDDARKRIAGAIQTYNLDLVLI